MELLIDLSLLHIKFLKLSTSIRNLVRVEVVELSEEDGELLILANDLLRFPPEDPDPLDPSDPAADVLKAPNLLLNATFLLVGDDDEDEALS